MREPERTPLGGCCSPSRTRRGQELAGDLLDKLRALDEPLEPLQSNEPRRDTPIAERTAASYPDLDEALRLFGDLLVAHGRPRDIVWVFRDTIATHRSMIYMWLPRLCHEDGVGPVRELYEEGRRRGFGARMINVAADEQRSICYLWIPRDETEAACSALHGALRMTLEAETYGIHFVQRALAWALLKLRNRLLRNYGLENEVPARPAMGRSL